MSINIYSTKAKKYNQIKFLTIILISLFSATGCTQGSNNEATATEEQTPLTIGWVEKGKIAEIDSEVKFKLDTGAKTTSINAEILSQPEDETESGGMIKFRYFDEDKVEKVYELPITRWVKIEKSNEGDYERRPVVKMKLCLAGRWVEEEVNLAD